MTWHTRERELKGEIMRTDIFIKVLSEVRDPDLMDADMESAFVLLRNFEARFSRFREGSELSLLNSSIGPCPVSDDLWGILGRCREYFNETDGIFDPTVLPLLEREGYAASYGTDAFGRSEISLSEPKQCSFADVVLDAETRMVTRPSGCRIDLGGIGKGYVVDRVAELLGASYADFIVDAGGDMRVAGRDRLAGYPYFAIDIEDAVQKSGSAGTLLLSDRAVATSGVNRRKWLIDGVEKSHLIDTRSGGSVEGGIMTVTVVSDTAERADVMAKTLCLLGRDRWRLFAEERKIAAFVILKDGTIETNQFIQPYLWGGNIFS